MANTNSGNGQGSNGKDQELVTKYLADQMALESHIYQAIDKQVKATEDEPDVNPFLRQIASTFEQHTNSLKARLEALGGKATSPVKEAGSAVLGVAAGVIDKVRSEEVSKDFRDNYTAISLSNISYVMLITTSLALGDQETARLAARNLKENASIIMEIGHRIPGVVVRDLSDSANVNSSVVPQAQQMYSDAWKNPQFGQQTATSGSASR